MLTPVGIYRKHIAASLYFIDHCQTRATDTKHPHFWGVS